VVDAVLSALRYQGESASSIGAEASRSSPRRRPLILPKRRPATEYRKEPSRDK
jgi:hypothetical protein